MAEYEVGVIHGRFQILHNDHLKYLLAGKKMCRHLVIGITNPDPHLTNEVDADHNRSGILSNPMTYYERLIMIREVMLEAGLTQEQMTITPLPITMPELFRYYVPMDALFLLSIYDDWGRLKLAQFKSMELKTHVLWEVKPEQKGISASDVRKLMLKDKPWEHLVPRAAARLLEAWDIPGRLKEINKLGK
jgi:nicotinamide mononucleotide adenylyltransferase